jgi:predicted Zn finger-like uncharacterized protein
MFATCPRCSLKLGLSAGELRLGQGQVRCGGCGNVFNALSSLTDEGESRDLPPAPATRPDADPPASRSQEVRATVIPVIVPSPELTADPTQATDEHRRLRTGTFETIALAGEDTADAVEAAPEEAVDAQLQALVQRFDAVREPAAASGEIPPRRAAQPPGPVTAEDLGNAEAAQGPLAPAHARAHDPDESDEEPSNALAQGWAPEPPASTEAQWRGFGERPPASEFLAAEPHDAGEQADGPPWGASAAVIGLTLLLVGQVVHHFRDSLAQQPWAHDPRTRLYGLLGPPLEPQ